MSKTFHMVLLFAAAAIAGGCSGEYKVAPIPAEEEAPKAAVAPQPSATPPTEPGAAVSAQPMTEAATTRTSGASAALPGSPTIGLSAGVALAQTIPTGTAMGFSVDYRFTRGNPAPGSHYVWVIEGKSAQPVRQDVQLNTRGTLQTFVPQWRPENGPFRCHIEDSSGQSLSTSEALR